MSGFHLRRPAGLPLAFQLMALLVAALVAAQTVTLALTLLFPPEQPRHWNLAQVADALATGRLDTHGDHDLEIQRMAGPPDISGAGWLISQSSVHALAQRLHAPDNAVVLAFYTQLPVGGVAAPSDDPHNFAARDSIWPQRMGHAGTALFNGQMADSVIDTMFPAAQAGGVPGAPGGAGMPMGGLPGGHFPGGGFPGGHLPGGQMPGGRPAGLPGHGTATGHSPASHSPAPPPTPPHQPVIPEIMQQPSDALVHPQAIPATVGPAMSLPQATSTRTLPPAAHAVPMSTHTAPVQSAASLFATPKAVTPPHAAATPLGAPQPIPFRRARSGLMALTTPPFLEGDFIAAARQADGSWRAVAPAAQPFPNRWQKQVLVWFLFSLAIVSPLAWLFARAIVTPLQGFARAAEALGRDPSTRLLPLTGPAEVGRAANAFNVMQSRLRAFVDDRTAMVGAISHDLRTPLTRLRFRIEDAPEPLRAGLLKEVTEMEAMIAQVITFIRDAATPGPREMVDFGDLVRASVADAQLVGGHIALEAHGRLPVEVDPVGMRRLLGNLLENALKYGEHTHVRVTLSDREAVAEVIDDGPGIPEDEWDHVFEPFYRTEAARKSGKPGSGLGLAVCRSIARAHGGDVALGRLPDGFVARLRVPLVYDDIRRAA